MERAGRSYKPALGWMRFGRGASRWHLYWGCWNHLCRAPVVASLVDVPYPVAAWVAGWGRLGSQTKLSCVPPNLISKQSVLPKHITLMLWRVVKQLTCDADTVNEWSLRASQWSKKALTSSSSCCICVATPSTLANLGDTAASQCRSRRASLSKFKLQLSAVHGGWFCTLETINNIAINLQ